MRRYVTSNTVPRSVGAGRVLCHNRVQHGDDTGCGVNGFRGWTCETAEKPKTFVKCLCGWSGLPHFAWREHVSVYNKDGTRKDGRQKRAARE
jgi:hypothetical protein